MRAFGVASRLAENPSTTDPSTTDPSTTDTSTTDTSTTAPSRPPPSSDRRPAWDAAAGAQAGLPLRFAGALWRARPSGTMWREDLRLLAVADLHLGKSERLARRGGALLPPYDTEETLRRLEAEITALQPQTVISLGDSFDDPSAARALPAGHRARLDRLTAGRRWIWLSGNHDPAPADARLPGEWAASCALGGVTFRHIADPAAGAPEMSGHFHPKATLWARGRRLQRRCALADARRVILAAFGAYTGGLDASDAVFDRLLGPDAAALLLSGGAVHAAPRRGLAGRS